MAPAMNDSFWLDQAFALLWASVGKTSPNPAVAAIIVKEQAIIGQGVHIISGGKHAEVLVIADAVNLNQGLDTVDLSGATLYVTLEPCNHAGKTPACTKAILAAGISRVVYGCVDHNPHVAGSGAKYLKQQGLTVTSAEHADCQEFYQAFADWASKGISSVTLKVAVDSLFNVAADDASALALTSAAMHAKVAHWRSFHDAIITSDNCIINDNPRLNCRLPNNTETKPLIVLATKDVFNSGQNIFQTCGPIHIFLPDGLHLKDSELQGRVNIHYYQGASIAWEDLLKTTAKLGWHRLWAEFGAATTRICLEQQLVTDALILQGQTTYALSRYHLRDLQMPSYPVHNTVIIETGEIIQHYGFSKFPELFLDRQRICLPG